MRVSGAGVLASRRRQQPAGTFGTALWPWFDTSFGGSWTKGAMPASVGRTVDVTSMSALQTACTNAINGDTIRLKAPVGTTATFNGLLDWETHSYSQANPVQIIQFPGHTVTLSNTSSTHGIYMRGLNGVRLSGVIIDNTRICGIKFESCQDMELRNVSVTRSGQVSEGEGILAADACQRVVLWGCRTSNCAEHGMYLGSFFGSTTFGMNGLLVANCASYDNYNGPATTSGGFGIQIGDSVKHGRIVGCTADGNGGPTGSGGGMNLFTQGTVTGEKGTDVDFYNDIATNNFAGGIIGSGTAPNKSTNHVGHCLAFGNGSTDFVADGILTIDGTNRHADPLFVNRAAKNFKPGGGSPAISAADASWLPDTDITGAARVTADIGCYAA